MNFLARKTLFDFAPFGWLFHSLDAIPIDRDGIGLSSLKESLRRLKQGEIVAIFPEGRRTSDGKIAPFRAGFTVLASAAGRRSCRWPSRAAYAAWPRSQRFPRPGRVHVRYGKLMPPDEIQGREERELAAEVERRIRQCQAEILLHPDFAKRRGAG